MKKLDNIGMESIFVTEGGAWKLANFENTCPSVEATALFLKDLKRLKDVVPPEESDNMVAFPIEKKYAHCRDVYALGILLGIFNKKARFASEIKSQELEDLLEELLQKDFRSRPKGSDLLDTVALTSDYIEIVNFLQSITLKNKADKKKFFSNLIPRLKKACISYELIAKRIAKLLLSPVVLAETDAVENIIPRLLTPIPLRPQVPSQGLVSSGMFARYVIPQIVDLLDDSVLPEVLLGLHDSNNQLVKASLHALADAVPIVGGDLIVGTECEKIFSFGMPKFNGIVLVNTSSIDCEMKPKRKPKKKEPKRPVTLLELALSREKSPSKVQRDLMMLKQNELARALEVIHIDGSNGHIKGQDAIHDIGPANNKSKPAFIPSSAKANGEVEDMKSLPESPSPPLRREENMTELRQNEIKEPEIETWAASASEDETWVDFDNYEGEKSTGQSPEVNMLDAFPSVAEDKEISSKRNSAAEEVLTLSNQVQEKEENNDTSPVKQPIEDLGTKFEISVKLKPEATTQEPDFFADMTPDIPTRTVPTLPSTQVINRALVASATSSISTESTKSSPMSVSFTAADLADDEATDGWDNDLVAWDD